VTKGEKETGPAGATLRGRSRLPWRPSDGLGRGNAAGPAAGKPHHAVQAGTQGTGTGRAGSGHAGRAGRGSARLARPQGCQGGATLTGSQGSGQAGTDGSRGSQGSGRRLSAGTGISLSAGSLSAGSQPVPVGSLSAGSGRHTGAVGSLNTGTGAPVERQGPGHQPCPLRPAGAPWRASRAAIRRR